MTMSGIDPDVTEIEPSQRRAGYIIPPGMLSEEVHVLMPERGTEASSGNREGEVVGDVVERVNRPESEIPVV